MLDELLAEIEVRMVKSWRSTEQEFNHIRAGRASTACSTPSRWTTTGRHGAQSGGKPRRAEPGCSRCRLGKEHAPIIEKPSWRQPRADAHERRQHHPYSHPALTEERRKELVKRVKQIAEEAAWPSATCGAAASSRPSSSRRAIDHRGRSQAGQRADPEADRSDHQRSGRGLAKKPTRSWKSEAPVPG